MKLSRKICDCAQSPIRKFYPYAVAAQQRGIRIHQLNIGQPDIQTPPAFFEAIEAGRRDVLAYAESPGIPALLEAIRAYYARIGASFETQDILVTTGGSEALLMAMLCILDEGDEVLIPEPYYPNYFTFIRMAGGRVHPIPTSPEDGYRYAERARVEPHITEKTRAILLSNPGNPTGTVLTRRSCASWRISPASTACISSATRSTANLSMTARSLPRRAASAISTRISFSSIPFRSASAPAARASVRSSPATAAS